MTATLSPLLTAVQGIVCLRVLVSNEGLTAGLLPGALMLYGASVQHLTAPLPCRCFASFCLTFFRQSLCRTQVPKDHPLYCCKLLAKQFCCTRFMHAKSKGLTGTSYTWKERQQITNMQPAPAKAHAHDLSTITIRLACIAPAVPSAAFCLADALTGCAALTSSASGSCASALVSCALASPAACSLLLAVPP